MEQKMVETVLSRQPHYTFGIGLLNTHLRIKQQYGEGLQIQSKYGEGTKISFKAYK